MQDELSAVLNLIHPCRGGAADRSREQVLEAFGAWLRVAAGSPHLDGAALAAHPLTAAAMAGLQARPGFTTRVCEMTGSLTLTMRGWLRTMIISITVAGPRRTCPW